MGARPSSFKSGGGGFLHDVTLKIVDYVFTTDSPGGGSNGDYVFFKLDIRQDGADDDESTSLFVGKAEDFEIEDDGKTLVPNDPAWSFNRFSDVGRFLGSLVEAGFDEEELPEDKFNYEAIVGLRIHTLQERNEQDMKYRAAEFKKGKGKGEYNEQGQRKGKDGKYYDIRYLSVSEVYGKEESAGKSSKGSKGSKSSKAVEPDEDETDTLAAETLLKVLDTNKASKAKPFAKSKLPNAIAVAMGTKSPKLQEVRKLIYTDEFLERENGWKYDKAKQTITLA